MKPLVVANWKMNPNSAATARALFGAVARGVARVRGVEVAVAPPFPYLGLFRRGERRLTLAAQDVFWQPRGPYTGEVSSPMLADLGVRYVIIGHSERRRLGESEEAINRKVKAALAAGLHAIVAICEEARESEEVTPQFLSRQLSSALAGVPRAKLRNLVVAYEPVWAISTAPGSKPDSSDHATRRAIYIRKLLTKFLGSRTANAIRILYGGSVTAKNAASFLAHDIRGMEGLLVGGSSLSAEEFVRIVQSVAAHRRQ